MQTMNDLAILRPAAIRRGSRRPNRRLRGALLLICVSLCACSGSPPADLGDGSRGLAPCPGSPNCVSSLAPDEAHFIAPFRYTRPRPEVEAALKEHLRSRERVRITREEPGYLRAEATTLLMRYVDDLEFWFRAPGVIEIRSASRLGYSDLGVNRRRIESIRTALADWLHD